ncbi:hypothetical protein C2E23DRAFT_281276 [Lenzites betulinus]|nr:hypothetical protein C2E23DRAFT_281276 [Lenzites betulinus]
MRTWPGLTSPCVQLRSTGKVTSDTVLKFMSTSSLTFLTKTVPFHHFMKDVVSQSTRCAARTASHRCVALSPCVLNVAWYVAFGTAFIDLFFHSMRCIMSVEVIGGGCVKREDCA